MNKNYVYPATLLCDFYKVSHREQYPKGTDVVYSTWIPRASRINGVNQVVAFGFQSFIKEYIIKYFNENFFNRLKNDVIDEYKRVIKYTLGVENPDTIHIEQLHNLGYMPIKIKAVKEGILIPLRVPMLTVENTKPEFFWLTNYLETLMSCSMWIPTTSATIAFEYRKILEQYAKETNGDTSIVPFQGHDFSMRGMGALDSAKSSGAGHLLSFVGTDSIPSILFAEDYYNANIEKELIGTSIPATEHSVMCAYGRDEFESYKRIITEVYPNGFVSIVSDTWDLWQVLTDVVAKLKNEIMNRDGKVVIRPDSGDPVKIICGDPESENELERKGVVELLWDIFGGTITDKGYKQLDSHIGCIYGDAITIERCTAICEELKTKGFASTNMVYGIGSFCVTPDTKILCSDLIWRDAGTLEIGQEIICFDENPIFYEGKKPSRKYRLGKITANNSAEKECIEIKCGDKKIKCSIDHPFLVYGSRQNREDFYNKDLLKDYENIRNMPRGYGLIWKKANKLKIGDKIAYFQKPWEQVNDNNIGWLAGIYDGEGSFGRGNKTLLTTSSYKINISQNNGLVLDHILNILKDLGFESYNNETKSGCMRVVLKGGFLETIRFLGMIRPLRFIDKLKESLSLLPGFKENATYNYQEITEINNIGMQEVASITTSEGTFITEGFLTHNTYQYNTRDTFGFALKSTHVVIDGQEHNIYKDPATDKDKIKKSLVGRACVLNDNGLIYTIDDLSIDQQNKYNNDMLEDVFVDGKLLRDENFIDIRNRLLGNL